MDLEPLLWFVGSWVVVLALVGLGYLLDGHR
jgi:hypothetical protein